MRLIVEYLLSGVANKWYSIGLFLGIPYKHMELFKMEDSIEESITEMVKAWLKRKYDVKAFGEPSWRKLVEAVASRSGGGHCGLATKIASDHPCYDVKSNREPAWRNGASGKRHIISEPYTQDLSLECSVSACREAINALCRCVAAISLPFHW